LRRAHEAPRIQRTLGLARDRAQAPLARRHWRVCHAVAGVQGNPHGGPDGERASDRDQPPGGPCGSGAQPAAAEGGRSRTARRAGHGEVERQEAGGEGSGALMAKVPLLDRSGKKVSDRELPAGLFEAPVNVPLMHQVVVAGMAALRRGTHSTKTRAEVSGGGRKPWRQKGTGRARHGSNRSPIWTGGGIAHGPTPRNHAMRVNKKMRRAALRGALTDALRSGKLAVVDELSFEEPKTKDAVGVLEALDLRGRILLVLPEPEEPVERSFRNLAHVKIT